jgi:DNA replication and repair protein RecF
MHYLCTLSSPRVSTDLPLIRAGATSAFLRGEAEAGSARFLVEVEIRTGGQNRVQVNRSAVRRKRDLRRHLRSVFSGPDDLHVVQGDPSERRRFLDEAVRTLWPARESTATSYERVLRQRNRLLKDADGAPPLDLAAWDTELVMHGAALTRARAAAAEAVRRTAGEEFGSLAGQTDEVLVATYVPSAGPVEAALEDGTEELERIFRERMVLRRGDELVRRTTLVGPHRDELELRIQGLVARGFASHGEAWGAAVVLRLALAAAVGRDIGELPLLLLDDPFSGLDPERRRRLSGRLEGRGQAILAVPDDEHVPPGAAIWRVGEGVRVEG